MSPHLSQETKALLHAAEALTAEVRRIADALTTPATPRLLDCGLCYEENGEECHPHPECPIGSTTSPLREQIADAIGSTNLPMWHKEHRYEAADAVLPVILPTTRLLGELHRSAHEDVQRVIGLYEQWVKAGPPPLGASMARWWDARLAELHAAINPPEHAEDPT